MTSATGDRNDVRQLVELADIERAHKRILPYVHRTPLLTSSTLDRLASEAINRRSSSSMAEASSSSSSSSSQPPNVRVRLAFKSEHLQRVGAFKMRGATNAVQTHLERLRAASSGHFDPAKLWVVTHSSGNHAAAVACAARSVGANAAVVMPRTAPEVKKAAVAGYGAHIVECEPTQAAREKAADELMDRLKGEKDGNVVEFIHPYDEALVIAGQGTLGVEMLQQARALEGRRRCSEAEKDAGAAHRADDAVWAERDSGEEAVLDIVVAPVGGGGMLSGVSTAVKAMDDRIIVIAAEPELADDAKRSFDTGVLQPAVTPPKTICDGLLTALSPFTLQHVQRNVKAILTASEKEIVGALRLVWERMKQIIEPSAAVGVAVVLDSQDFAHVVQQIAEQKIKRGKADKDGNVDVRIGVVWTGGNVELVKVARALEQQER